MWWFIKGTLCGAFVEPSVEYFGLFPSRASAEDYAERVFDASDVTVEFFQMVMVWEAN